MRTSWKGAALACVGVLVTSLFVVLGFGAASAGAATYPPTTCATIAVSTTTPRPGQTITVTGEEFQANAQVTLTMTPYGITLAKVTTDSNGKFSTGVTIPLDARGHQLIHANGPGKVCPADPIQITVSGGAGGGGSTGTGGTGGPPAMTGVDVALLVGVALALLGAGVLFTRGGRRSRHAGTRL
jgi:hypothetical protein